MMATFVAHCECFQAAGNPQIFSEMIRVEAPTALEASVGASMEKRCAYSSSVGCRHGSLGTIAS